MSGDEDLGMVRLQINAEVCIGAGQCEMLEEETFLLDDDSGLAGIIGTGMLPLDSANKVIDSCPSRAISVADG